MQIHSVQHTGTSRSVENHCPHGRVGACSDCNPMGGGGGGGGSAKRSTSGLMTWNQAWALWSSLQLSGARQKEYLKGMQTNQFRLQQEGIAQPGRLLMAVARFIQATRLQTIGHRLNMAARSFNQFANSMQNGMRTLIQTALQGLERINIADKLATILGESKKLLDDILQHNVQMLKDLMARFQFFERLAQVSHLMEKMLKTLASEATQWIRETAERVEQVWEQLKRWFKKTSQNPKQKRHSQK